MRDWINKIICGDWFDYILDICIGRGGVSMRTRKAIELAKSGWWRNKTAEEIVSFQLYEDLLCMDFSDFHGAVEKVLGRPVWTHEFGSIGREILKAEFEKKVPKRTVNDSINLLRKLVGDEKIILIKTKGGDSNGY